MVFASRDSLFLTMKNIMQKKIAANKKELNHSVVKNHNKNHARAELKEKKRKRKTTTTNCPEDISFNVFMNPSFNRHFNASIAAIICILQNVFIIFSYGWP